MLRRSFFGHVCFEFSVLCPCSVARETRVGWPLLTVETELNVNSKSTNERGFLCWFVGTVVPVQEIFV
jgi:hypothetical protein